MSLTVFVPAEKSRLRALLDHFSIIEDTREPWRVAYPLQEVLLLVVCGTVADCDDYEGIAQWGEAHLPFLRRFLPYHHGVPCARWLTILMNRIDPALFSAAFTGWVRETWPDRLDLVAIDGKNSRRSHPGRPQRCAGLDRCDPDQPRHRDDDQERPGRLPSRREIQSADPALRNRDLLRGGPARQSRQRHGCGQGPRPHRATNRYCRPRGRLAPRRAALPRRG